MIFVFRPSTLLSRRVHLFQTHRSTVRVYCYFRLSFSFSPFVVPVAPSPHHHSNSISFYPLTIFPLSPLSTWSVYVPPNEDASSMLFKSRMGLFEETFLSCRSFSSPKHWNQLGASFNVVGDADAVRSAVTTVHGEYGLRHWSCAFGWFQYRGHAPLRIGFASQCFLLHHFLAMSFHPHHSYHVLIMLLFVICATFLESLGIIASSNYRKGAELVKLWPSAEPVTLDTEGEGLSFSADIAQRCALGAIQGRNSTIPTSIRTLISGCWPFTDLVHMTYASSFSGSGCEYARHIMTFQSYILSDTVQDSFQKSDQLVSLPPETRSISFDLMSAVMCSSSGYSISNPQPTSYELSASSFFISTIASTLGLIYAALAGGLIVYWRNDDVLKRGSIKFQLFIVIGCMVLYSTPMMFVQERPTSASCSSSVWMYGLGFAVTFGSLLAKNWRVYRIFCQAIKKLRVVRIPDRELFMIYGSVIMMMTTVLSAWQAVDPLEAQKFIIHATESSLGSTIYQCRTDSSLFPFLFIVAQGAVILYGCMLAFKSRIVSADFTEAKPVGLSMYNYFFTLIVVGPVVSVVQDNQEAVYMILTLGVTWITTITLTLVLYTRFYQIITGEDIWMTTAASGAETGVAYTPSVKGSRTVTGINTPSEVRGTPQSPSGVSFTSASRSRESVNDRFSVRRTSAGKGIASSAGEQSFVRDTRIQIRSSAVAPLPSSSSSNPSSPVNKVASQLQPHRGSLRSSSGSNVDRDHSM